MTKAEAWITYNSDSPWKLTERLTGSRHDGTEYAIRVFEADIDGEHYRLVCDGYYGEAKLFMNDTALGEYEHRYESIPR